GVPEQQLMGQAALASLYALKAAGILTTCERLVILCGPGNNGGDGYALACMLASGPLEGVGQSPLRIQIFATAPPKSSAARHYAGLAGELAGIAPEAGAGPVRVSLLGAEDFLKLPADSLGPRDCVVDALLGTGQSAPPRGVIAKVLAHLQSFQRGTNPRVVSLDLPVGLREDAPDGDVLLPDEVHSYGVDKAALRLNPTIAAHSRIRVLPMGFLPWRTASAARDRRQNKTDLSAADDTGPSASAPIIEETRRPWIRSLSFTGDSLPVLKNLIDKAPLAHKYQAGHGLLIGGSPGMEGALLMAARSFFAAGGGILHAVVPDPESRRFLTATLPGVMFLDHSRPLPPDLRPGAIAVGPGLAGDDLEAAVRLLKPLFDRRAAESAPGRIVTPTKPAGRQSPVAAQEPRPWLILDAGALAFARDARFPEGLRARTILTPHTGEWKRLGGAPIDCVRALDEAADFHAREIGGYCLVKDAVSVLLGPDRTAPIGIRHRPNPALAVAGSGDNLVGILLALFARRHGEATSPAVPAFERIAAALELLDRAARLEHHPRADQFPDLIRSALGEHADPAPETRTPDGRTGTDPRSQVL
ncbi:MAG: bifunctional ADP-dependent NAD(P)H-hydrate dehydratase/NAD(P)H-hydrate epimerase, partial [Leptospirales bacterium]